jgi:hypothetical protein
MPISSIKSAFVGRGDGITWLLIDLGPVTASSQDYIAISGKEIHSAIIIVPHQSLLH